MAAAVLPSVLALAIFLPQQATWRSIQAIATALTLGIWPVPRYVPGVNGQLKTHLEHLEGCRRAETWSGARLSTLNLCPGPNFDCPELGRWS